MAAQMKVAPYAGAWIEMFATVFQSKIILSPLTQGRGLKLRKTISRPKFFVAPYAGAWIEI